MGGIVGEGKTVLPTDHCVIIAEQDDPYHMVYTPRGKWGYIDRRGKIVIDTRFDNAGGFLPEREVAMVELDGTICLIDRKGEVVLKTVFSDLLAYNPETMVCAMEYTDQSGKVKSCLAKLVFPQ